MISDKTLNITTKQKKVSNHCIHAETYFPYISCVLCNFRRSGSLKLIQRARPLPVTSWNFCVATCAFRRDHQRKTAAGSAGIDLAKTADLRTPKKRCQYYTSQHA